MIESEVARVSVNLSGFSGSHFWGYAAECETISNSVDMLPKKVQVVDNAN